MAKIAQIRWQAKTQSRIIRVISSGKFDRVPNNALNGFAPWQSVAGHGDITDKINPLA